MYAEIRALLDERAFWVLALIVMSGTWLANVAAGGEKVGEIVDQWAQLVNASVVKKADADAMVAKASSTKLSLVYTQDALRGRAIIAELMRTGEHSEPYIAPDNYRVVGVPWPDRHSFRIKTSDFEACVATCVPATSACRAVSFDATGECQRRSSVTDAGFDVDVRSKVW